MIIIKNVEELIRSILQNVQEGKIDTDIAFPIVRNLKEIQDSKETVKNDDIAVIGMACRFPEANNTSEYWKNIEQKKCSIRTLPKERENDVKEQFRHNNLDNEVILEAGYLDEIDKFDARFFKIPMKEVAFIHPMQRLFLETSYEAFEDAGYGGNLAYNTKTGVYIGVDHSIEFDYAKQYGQNDILSVLGSYSSLIANRISYLFNLRGPAIVVDTACSSGLVAVHQACQGLQNNECDMAIAGGVNLLFYRQKTALSGVESGNSKVRVFDKEANGTVWGEGVGSLLLKPLKKAQADGDHIYVIIKGSAVNSDGASNGITAPNAEAQTELLIQAWKNAKIDPTTIEYIETHGTGTVLGDPIEIKGLNDAFRCYSQKRQFCAINSVKNNIGHTCGVSGIASLIKVILAINNKQIPMNINFNRPNPFVNFLDSAVYVNDQFMPWVTNGHPRRAGVSAFGLSGTNCHLVVEEALVMNNHVIPDEMYVIALSAQYKEGVIELVRRYYDVICAYPDIDVKSLCITANTGRGHYNYRLITKFKNASDLRNKLQQVKDKNDLDNLEIQDVYYKKHEIIADKHEECENGKYTEQEVNEISNDINHKIQQVNKNRKLYFELLDKICVAYIKGGDVNWSEFYKDQTYKKLSLPTYPYQKLRCWPNDTKTKYKWLDSVTDTFYHIKWVPKNLQVEEFSYNQENILVFQNQMEESRNLVQALKQQGVNLIEVTQSKEYKKINENQYLIGFDEESYTALFLSLREKNITQIIHIQSLSYEEAHTIQQMEKVQENGVMSLFYITRAWCRAYKGKEIEIVLVSNYVNEVTGEEEKINPHSAALFGLGKVIGQENTKLHCRAIDVDGHTGLKELLQEVRYGKDIYQVAYRKGNRFIEELHQLDEDKIEDNKFPIHQDGVYVITGGLGGIGLEISKYLAKKGCVNLAFFNRTQIPARDMWKEIIAKQEDSKVVKSILKIQELETAGLNVCCYSLNVTEYDKVNRAFVELRNTYGAINGIIHCAGIAEDDRIEEKKDSVFRSILEVKMKGMWILDQLTERDNLDFFIVFSSISSLVGGIGKGDYTAGNAYLDAYAAYRSKKGKRTLSINWPIWKDTGMAAENSANKDGIFKAIETSQALECFDKVWTKKINRVVIGTINNMRYRIQYIPIPNLRSIQIKYLKESDWRERVAEVILKGREDYAYTELEKKVGMIWGDILGLDVIHIDDNFYELGGNSIHAIQMEVGMESQGMQITADDLKTQETIRKLAEYISKTTKKNKDCFMIEPIVPFNEVFYKECFYNSLFPIIMHHNGNIGYFLVNDIITYKYDVNNINQVKFEVNYLPVQEQKYLFDACGVSFASKDQTLNVIEEAKTSILNGKAVIVWIDCFFESIRKDVYKKEHLPHTLLLYGFDEQKRVFYIVEHTNRDNLSYKNNTISYEELLECYQGYLERFKGKHREMTYYEFFVSSRKNAVLHKNGSSPNQIMKENVLNHKRELQDSIVVLKKIVNDIQMLLSNEDMLKENRTVLVNRINDIMNAKELERYRLENYGSDTEHLLSLLGEIKNNWEKVRAWIVKYMLTSVYQENSLKMILSYLGDIPSIEYEFVLTLMKEL